VDATNLEVLAEKTEERPAVAAKRLKSTFLGIVQKERLIGEKPWRATSELMRGLGSFDRYVNYS